MPTKVTHEDTYQLTKLCAAAELAGPRLRLDCRRTCRLGPIGVTLLASVLAVRKLDGKHTEILWPEEESAVHFLKEVGFDRFAEGEETGHRSLELRQLHSLDVMYTDAVLDLLCDGVDGIDRENGYPIQLCLNELLQNVFEWAHSPVGCFVLARWYRQGCVRLAVVDRGIGIPAALRRKQVRGLQREKDADVIEAAVTVQHLTSRENRVGGLGLKTIREVVCGNEGRLTVSSLGGKVTWSPRGLRKYSTPLLRGTAIEVDIRPRRHTLTPSSTPAPF